MAVRILVTDRHLAPVGGPIPGWSRLDVTVRHMTAGAGTFRVPARPAVLAQLAAGHRIVIVRQSPGQPARIFAAGPLEGEPGEWEWSASPDGAGPGPGTLTVTFTTDEAAVLERITYPDPAQPADGQTADRWTMTGTGEQVMRALVDTNAGPAALAERRVSGLILGQLAGVGDTITYSTRFEAIGDALRTVSLAAGGLGWRITQAADVLRFEVFAPADRTNEVRFSRGLGNLRSFRYSPTSPSCTAAIVGGPGEGAARLIRERLDTAAAARWRRAERFVDRRQADQVAELDQAGDDALSDGAETVGLQTETVDTPRQAFGTHFGLGDRVGVELAPGVVVPDVVTAARLTADARAGERVTCSVGNRPAGSDLDWLIEMRRLARRISQLEAV
ncbi:siphovirus ReqiPepy6 Gp37-like family protein [Salinispora cortesiana]|uniref:siphovirus ReqiPepy6 Gp37-like family protein n=1 Tax=Salinispora cortesiana TaxID=1305843 RepID=UPI0003FC654F|nr:siphovirus ReqiPepy6 Gp37-like family protein [Salinispora cortesiana]